MRARTDPIAVVRITLRVVSGLRIALLAVALGACAATTTPSPLESIERTVGQGDGPIVVLLHGFGSVPETFLGLAERRDLPPGTRLVFPRAPLAIPGVAHGSMWWPLPRDYASIPLARYPGMNEARERVSALLDQITAQAPHRPLVLGGFSQGAMVTLDVALHDARPLAGIALMSGTMIDEHDTMARLESRRGLRVYASHGRQDPVLRYQDDARLMDAMRAHGLDVSFTSFDGRHVVTEQVSMEVAAFVTRCAESR